MNHLRWHVSVGARPIIERLNTELRANRRKAPTVARADADYVYVDMEHTPLDFPGLNQFAMGMVDKATALKKGSPAPNMALFARFPPYGREGEQWIAKQVLDAGLMGIIFNGMDTPEHSRQRR